MKVITALAVLVIAAAATTVVALQSGDRSADAAPTIVAAQTPTGCEPGQAPAKDYGQRPPEDHLSYATTPVLLGCLAIPGEQSVQLVGYRLASRHGRPLCIDRVNPVTARASGGCGSDRMPGSAAIDATASTHDELGPSLVSGAVDPSADTVVVRYELDGQLREQRAAVLTVRDPRLLQAIEVDGPIGQYLAQVPSGARGVGVEARDAQGRPLDVAFFSGFPAATGKGRACLSRPQITDVRLVGPARTEHTSRLRVAVRYPAGRVTSVAATIFVEGDTARAKLTQTQSTQVVTLPLRFERRGLLAVDVTADGRPADRQACSSASLPRAAAPSTIAVRVR
jgi:hypothetical protein